MDQDFLDYVIDHLTDQPRYSIEELATLYPVPVITTTQHDDD